MNKIKKKLKNEFRQRLQPKKKKKKNQNYIGDDSASRILISTCLSKQTSRQG